MECAEDVKPEQDVKNTIAGVENGIGRCVRTTLDHQSQQYPRSLISCLLTWVVTRAIMTELQEVDMELDELSDQLPDGSGLRSNPRYAKSAREKELEDESHHLGKLTAMLHAHGEQQTRLAEVTEDGGYSNDQEGGGDSPITVPTLSATATHRELVGLFQQQGQQQVDLSTMQEEGGSEEPANDGTLNESTEAGSGRSPIISLSMESLFTGQEQTEVSSISVESPTASGLDVFPTWQPQVRISLPPRLPPPGHGPRMTTPQTTGSFIYTSSANWRPQADARSSQPRYQQPLTSQASAVPPIVPHVRRRSQSNEFGEGEGGLRQGLLRRTQAEDNFHELKAGITTKQPGIATTLIGLEETLHNLGDCSSSPMDWLNQELDRVWNETLATERMEWDVRMLAARLQGPSARVARSEDWTRWNQQVCAKITALRQHVWTASARPQVTSRSALVPPTIHHHRSGGFLERVKLPT